MPPCESGHVLANAPVVPSFFGWCNLYPYCMKNSLSVVFFSWQQSEQGNISFMYETCSVSCHHHMTTVRVWLYPLKNESCSVSCHHLMTTTRARLFISKVWNMLRQLSSSNTYGQSTVIYPLIMNHAPSVVIISWQRTGHGNILFIYETYSVGCHRLMTTGRAWLHVPKVWIMVR